MKDEKKNKEEEITEEEVVEEPKLENLEEVVLEEESEDNTKKKSSGKNKKDEEVEELKARVEDLENQLKRAVADYRNQEMRFGEEKKEFVKFANRDLLLRLIPAFDTLFLAGKYVEDEGVKLTIKHLQDALAEVGVIRVKTEGEKFDAQTMEVVTTEDGEEGAVLEELRPGFMLNGKLVRPANVKVGKSATRD